MYVLVILGLITFVDVVAPVFQVYVFAPVADKVDELPTQMIELLDVAVSVDNGGTEIEIVLVELQPLVVPVTVYIVVVAGVAVTTAPEVELKPTEGDQEYVVAPPPVKETGATPRQ